MGVSVVLPHPAELLLTLPKRIEFPDESGDLTLFEPAVSSRPNTVCSYSPLFRPPAEGVRMDVQNFGYVAGLEHSVQLVRHNLPVASILVFFGKRTAPLVLSMYQAIRSHKPLWQVL